MTDKQVIDSNAVNPGKVHADLMGSMSAHRFRPERVELSRIKDAVLCRFALDGVEFGPLLVADVSQTGIGLIAPETAVPVMIPLGSMLDDLQVRIGNDVVWQGSGVCVYQVGGAAGRIGVRLTAEALDMAKLQVKGTDVARSIAAELERHEKFVTKLPPEWMARVGLLRELLESAKTVLDRAEQEVFGSRASEDTGIRRTNVEAMISEVYSAWGPVYTAALTELYETSKSFSSEMRELGRAYATRELSPLLYACPMHNRAYAKPRGYAGDYRLMTLYFKEAHEGPSLYARFLHNVSQRYTLGRTVLAREAFLREQIASCVEHHPSARIVSLACGPGLEVRNWAANARGEGNVKFVMVDQDEEALRYVNQTVGADVAKRVQQTPRIDVHCLHFSVKQLLKPGGHGEQAVVQEVLQGADMVYTSGLFDYLPQPLAQQLCRRLYGLLQPGGRLLIGNLQATPDTTWMMDYVLSWHLEYRTEAQMLDIAAGIAPKPRHVGVQTDKTGRCLFLDLSRDA